MLTRAFYEKYDPIPRAPVWPIIATSLRATMRVIGFRVNVEGELSSKPALLCTNSTQRHDFLALMRGLDARDQRVVTFSKAKNFHSRAQAFVMQRCGVLPLASRGYVIAIDFQRCFGRLPTDEEYRAIRDHVDRGSALGGGQAPALQERAREILGVPFDPRVTTYREHVHAVCAESLSHSVRLAKRCVDAGYHVQIYPEGTVSRQLGVGRTGAVQFARALGLDVVPIGMSGCPEAFLGQTPLPTPGTITIRIGEPLDLSAELPDDHVPFHPASEATNRAALLRATTKLMDRIEDLVDAPYKRPLGAPLPPKGVRAFL